ncbi:MAG: glycerophosphodiester phosphodiesterase family protein [Bacteroidales bacterium]|nr:glycerophosphodiester phosphodiesterase family protein [Bacteroidales bacterium]
MTKRLFFLLSLVISFSLSFAQIDFKSSEDLKSYFQWTPESKPLISAHRGGPYPGYPENCIETFEYVLTHMPAIIECDIALTKDGHLIMMHDNTLDRTTTGTGLVKQHSRKEIKKLQLKDSEGNITAYDIPTLREVLEWTKEKAILTLDIKRGVPLEEVISLVEETNSEAFAVIITYNIEQAKEVYNLNPDLMISASVRNEEELNSILVSGIPLENIIAFTGTSLKSAAFYDNLHAKGIYCILGTLGNLDNKAIAKGDTIYLDFISVGADILATDRPIEVAVLLRESGF